ncbi:MAG: hypothetical protein AMXMBFR84_10190 [Candidatus Hydrogenedentota bacterium]
MHSTPNVLVGPAGWSYADWKGIVYPPELPAKVHPVEFLAPYFDLIEINSSFYRPTPPHHCRTWIAKSAVNPEFVFAYKLWQRFTHERAVWPNAEEIAQVRSGLDVLSDANKLCALLIQFPWSFKRTPESRQWLARVLDEYKSYPIALELRHTSWERQEVTGELTRRNIALCGIDQPVFQDSIEPSLPITAQFGYIRLHGRNREAWFRSDASRDERYDYLYSTEELHPWVERIAGVQGGLEKVIVVTNNHFRGQAIANAVEIMRALGRKMENLPASLVEAFPRLAI